MDDPALSDPPTTRDRIVDAALAVYSQHGAGKTTTKEIASAAGVAQGLLYHYFRSKEDLLTAVIERHSFLPRMRAITAGADSRPARDVLLEIGAQFAQLLRTKEALIDLLLGSGRHVMEVKKARGQLMGEGLALFSTYLDARVAAGELRPHRTDLTARSLMATVIIMHLTGASDPPAIEALVDNLLDGVRSRPIEGDLS